MIWIALNYLQLLLCLVALIIAIHFRMVSWSLTSPKLQRVQNWLACVVTKSPPFTSSVALLRSLHWLPVKFRIQFKISLLTYKTLHEKQPIYLHSMLAPSLPSHSVRLSKGISLSVPRVKTNLGARVFILVPCLSGTTCRCLSILPIQLQTSRDINHQSIKLL